MLPSHKHWLAVIFLILSSLVSGYYSFFIKPPGILVNNDGAAQWEARMNALREQLPESVREVGYVSDSENPGSMIEEYVLTKYALIPIAVRHGTQYEWIVGNFTEEDIRTVLDAQISGSYDLKKFGSGIYLIHRSHP